MGVITFKKIKRQHGIVFLIMTVKSAGNENTYKRYRQNPAA